MAVDLPIRVLAPPGHVVFGLAVLAASTPVGRSGAQPPVWRVSARPDVVIDESTGPQGDFLRIVGLAKLPSGAIAVANGASAEVRLFSADGRHLRTLGRSGGGPGEFRQISWMGVSADTIFFADRTGARITTYLESGTLVRTVPIMAADSVGAFSVSGRLSDGRWLVRPLLNPRIDGPERLYRDTMSVGLLSPDGGRVAWLARLPSASVFVYNPRGTPNGLATGVAPLGPGAHVLADGGRIAFADMARPAIVIFNDQGRIERTLSLPYVAGEFDEAGVTEARRQRLEESRNGGANVMIGALYSKGARPPKMPVLGGMVRGLDGAFWVWPFTLADDVAKDYLVVDSNGRPLATVAGPARFRLREVGPDYLLGVRIDADGVESVVQYRLTRVGAS